MNNRENSANEESPSSFANTGRTMPAKDAGAFSAVFSFVHRFPKPLALLDRSLRYMAVSESWLHAYAMTETNVIGRSQEEILPEDHRSWREACLRCINTGHMEHLDFDFSITYGGSIDAIRWTAAPWYGEQNRIEGVMIYAETVSPERQENLEDTLDTQRLRLIIDTMADGIILLNDFGEIGLINPAISRILGYFPHEVIGKKIDLMIPIPDSLQEQPYTQKLLWIGQREEFLQGRKVYARCKSEESVPIELYSREMRCGTRTHILLTIRDLTDYVGILTQLQVQSVALHAAIDGIVITDKSGRILWANTAFYRMTGYDPFELVGKTTGILRSGMHDSSFYHDLWETVREGKVWDGDITNRRKSGDLYQEHMTITPVLDTFGAPEYYIAIKQDITEKKPQAPPIQESGDAFENTAQNQLEPPSIA